MPGFMASRVEQHVGLEPTHAAWKAAGLPLPKCCIMTLRPKDFVRTRLCFSPKSQPVAIPTTQT